MPGVSLLPYEMVCGTGDKGPGGAAEHSVVIFFICAVSDTFTGSDLFDRIYLREYGFMFVILSMSNTLVTQFAYVCSEVEKHNIHLEHKVAERTSELILARDALWGEMKLATKIQTVLHPRKPVIPGDEVAAYVKPAEAVGGGLLRHHSRHRHLLADHRGRNGALIGRGDKKRACHPRPLIMIRSVSDISSSISSKRTPWNMKKS